MLSSLVSLNKDILASNKNIVLIPGAGCGGCISNAISSVIKEIDNKNINVVLTGVIDLKLLKLQLGKDFLDREDVFIDPDNILMNTQISSVYPRLITVENQTIKEIVVYDP